MLKCGMQPWLNISTIRLAFSIIAQFAVVYKGTKLKLFIKLKA
jgi:hypothetical protein